MPQDFTTEPGAAAKDKYNRAIILLDSAEGTDRWVESGTGGDDGFTSETAACLMETQGFYIKTRATGAADGDYMDGYRRLPYPHGTLLVYRMRVAPFQAANIASIEMRIELKTGADLYKAALRWDIENETLKYLDSAGSYQEISGHGFSVVDQMWETMELQIDPSSMEYVKSFLHGIEDSLSGIAMQDAGNTTDHGLYVYIRVEAAGAAQAVVFADNIYVGEEE